MLFTSSTTRAQMPDDIVQAVAAKPVVNMYSTASTDSDVVSQTIYGTCVTIIKNNRLWSQIRTADGYVGWSLTTDFRLLKGSRYAPDSKAVRIAELSANIYDAPDVTRHAPLLQLPWEARLEVATPSTADLRWVEVILVDGRTAWVQRGDTSDNFTPLGISDTLQLARKFLGITYTWGGISSFGFDCSGFTQMLIRQRGIEMPRDANMQAIWSGVVSVERANAQPGDLLFFGTSIDKITHTGMYLGNGEFIHDTTHSHPGVQISHLDDIPWAQLLVAIRRIKP
jgi:hypothetical protein